MGDGSWVNCGDCFASGIVPDCRCGHEDCDWLHNPSLRIAQAEEMRGRDLAKARREAGIRARRAS